MLNKTLYCREMKRNVKLLVLFGLIISMYVYIIISMYDPKMMEMMDNFAKLMPELMAAMGMTTDTANLMAFMISYLYGFILLIFPMVFSILRGHGLVAAYVDKGSMASLLAAPVKRRTIILTQMAALISGIVILVVYSTVLEYVCAGGLFPGELEGQKLLLLNAGLLCLQLFIGSVCFLASTIFSDSKYSIGFGAGIPALMYVIQMLANVGGAAEKAKYFSFFTLYAPDKIVNGESGGISGIVILLVGAVILYAASAVIFEKRDLAI